MDTQSTPDYAATHNEALGLLRASTHTMFHHDVRRKCLERAYQTELCAISQCQDAALCLLMSAFAAQIALALRRYDDARCLCATVAALTEAPPKPKRGRRGVVIKPVLNEWQAQTEYARKEAERISKVVDEKCNGG